MWKTKNFKSYESQQNWIAANRHNYQITIIYVNNGYAVEYKPLFKINF